jgi:hypothetical protein
MVAGFASMEEFVEVLVFRRLRHAQREQEQKRQDMTRR